MLRSVSAWASATMTPAQSSVIRDMLEIRMARLSPGSFGSVGSSAEIARITGIGPYADTLNAAVFDYSSRDAGEKFNIVMPVTVHLKGNACLLEREAS
jgi:hypothetical protein